MTYGLLDGLKVIESSAFIAAPLCGLTLAQYGAEVIRIDPIGGGIDYNRMPRMPGGRSLYWTGLNKGKRSVAVDIRAPEGRELVAALATAAQAGVLLTNIAVPWLAHEVLAARRADMISCVIEGNPDGSTAVDYTVNCATGYPAMTGQPGGPPVNHALPAWDIACALQASTALAAAMLRRQATGAGAALRIALSDVAFATLSHLGVLAEAELLERDRPAIGNDIYGAFGRDFVTADGRRVMVAAISGRQWQALVAACGIGPGIAALEAATGLDFADEEDRFRGRDLIGALVALWFEGRGLAEVAEAFDRHGVCWGEYRTVRGLLAEDPRVSTANPLFEVIGTPGVGRHLAAGAVARIAGEARRAQRPAPALGADTDAVLAELLGLPSGAIGALHDRGIVAGPPAA
ncbi:MAG: CoA transferase [Rhodobacteraceae bacterium]|nr:CoA transferase [Paracoccaceae bacterium]